MPFYSYNTPERGKNMNDYNFKVVVDAGHGGY